MKTNNERVIASLKISFLFTLFLLVFSLASLTSVAYASSNNTAKGEWKTVYIVGKFLYSDPPKPDQIFKIQYRIINGTVESFHARDSVVAKVNASNDGILEIKFPRNYPYTNSEGISGIDNFAFFNNGQLDILDQDDRVTTDCFFVFSIPLTESIEAEIAWEYLLTKSPHHGDDISNSCIPQTVVENVPVKKDGAISPLHQFRAGVAAGDVKCKEGFELIISPTGKPYCAPPSIIEKLNKLWYK